MNHISSAEHTSEELQSRFGRNFREARVRAGLSQKQAADRTGTTQAYVSQIELGHKNLTLQSMAQLSAGLDSSVEALLIAERRTTTHGDLEQFVRVLHHQLEAISKTNRDSPVTIDSLCQIIRSVSSAIGAGSVIIQAETENTRKR